MARRSPTGRFPALRQGRRREMVWLPLAPTNTAFVPSQAVLFSSMNAAALALRPFTIVRTKGWMRIVSDQTANSENQYIIVGKIVVKSPAVTAGIASIPTPISEAGADFFVYESISAGLLVSSATSVLEAGQQRSYDSKAMRKVQDDEDIVSVAETPATGISEGLTLFTNDRILLKLH